MKLSREDFLKKVKDVIGDSTTDESLSFLEDMTETYDELSKASSSTEDWKTKYEENDKQWREKYKARFFEGNNEPDPEPDPEPEPSGENTTFDDLFSE